MQKSILPSSAWLRFFIATVLALGLFFRFANLERKYYWTDETYSSLRNSGYTEEDVVKQAFTGQIISVSLLHKFQNPNPEKGLISNVKILAQKDPHIPPLYFILLRSWTNLFGGSVTSTRSFSAVISLLVFPCIYWLCRELFQSQLVGWMAILLIAVSPFHVLYAQEARMYSLWTVTILLSSAALLRAMRFKTRMDWLTYTITLTLALYSHLFILETAIGHGIYVFVIERFRLTKTLRSYLLASLAGLILFFPWILMILQGDSQINDALDWSHKKLGLLTVAKSWFFNCSRLFFDIGLGGQSSGLTVLTVLLVSLIAVILFILVCYSIYYLCTKTQKSIWLFILIFILLLPLTLLSRDLLKGTDTSIIMRYLIPSCLGIQIAVAYLLSRQITDVSISYRRRKFWQSATTLLLSCGIISCVLISQAVSWWHTGPMNYKYFQVAQTINQSDQPLVISSTSMPTDTRIILSILSLSHLLDSKVKLQLTLYPDVPTIASNLSDVFLYQPPDSLLNSLKQKYEIKPSNSKQVTTNKDKILLWRLSSPKIK